MFSNSVDRTPSLFEVIFEYYSYFIVSFLVQQRENDFE